ncbi:MAG: hypothetical protein R6U31_02840 [bacterium]
MKKNTLSLKLRILFILMTAVFILLGVKGFYEILHLPNDYVEYYEESGYVIVDEIDPYSNAYQAGLLINDTLISVNGKLIDNKHYLFNKIFDRADPGDCLEYIVMKNGNIRRLSIPLHTYYTSGERLTIFISSVMLILFSVIFFIRSRKTLQEISLYLIFLICYLILIYVRIPFSHQWMYSVFIITSMFLPLMQYTFVSNMIYNSFNKTLFLIILSVLAVGMAFWLYNYLLWTITLSNAVYGHVRLSMKIFQFIVIIIAIANTFILFYKFFVSFAEFEEIRYLLFIILLCLLFMMYPVFLAIPVITKNKELLPFFLYFALYNIPAFIMAFYYDYLKELFIYEKE